MFARLQQVYGCEGLIIYRDSFVDLKKKRNLFLLQDLNSKITFKNHMQRVSHELVRLSISEASCSLSP